MNTFESILQTIADARQLARAAGRPAHDTVAARQAQQVKPTPRPSVRDQLQQGWNAITRQPQPATIPIRE